MRKSLIKSTLKFHIFAAIAACVTLYSNPCLAQQEPESDPNNGVVVTPRKIKPRNKVLIDAFKPVAKAQRYCVGRLRLNGATIGLATVVKPGMVVASRVSVGKSRGRFSFVASNGQEYSVTLKKSDPRNHVVLFSGGPNDLAVKQFASDPLFIGQFVVSVGASNTPVAAGCVSAMNRATSGRGPGASNIFAELFGGGDNSGPDFSYENIVQHDSKIAKDDYGSAVFNADGEFVGVNVERAYRGSSYLVLAEDIVKFINGEKIIGEKPEKPKQPEKVEAAPTEPEKTPAPANVSKKPGYIGFRASFVQLGSKSDAGGLAGTGFIRGMKLTEVASGSAADKAGLQVGDFVVELNGSLIVSFEQFVDQLRNKKVGERVILTVIRNSNQKRVVVTLGERPQ